MCVVKDHITIWLSAKEKNSKIATFLSTEVFIGANSKVQIDSIHHPKSH